jgi:hypothetical protein
MKALKVEQNRNKKAKVRRWGKKRERKGNPQGGLCCLLDL